VPESVDENFIYRSEYCQKSVIFVEGEKNASDGQMLNMNIISFIQHRLTFDNVCNVLKLYYIDTAIVIEDNDTTGRKKSQIMANSLWALKIPTKIVNLSEVYGIDQSGFDLSDSIKMGLFKLEDIV
jgi:hypothetical protein